MQLTNSIILITGGTGTFGAAFLNRCLLRGAKEIRIFSRDEKKQYSMMHQYPEQKVKFIIGDVRDRESLDRAIKDVDIVFHAAAMKHVPFCERFPFEAIQTNIIGSENVIASSIEHNVKKVICLSTDKAVYPTSMMGLTKACMEKIALGKAAEQSGTKICITRFNNLIMSNGSVIPFFLKTASEEKPLKITDPEMTRFFISIEEAMDLVEWASCNGNNGDIVTKIGEAWTLENVAKAVNILNNRPENSFVVIGARDGERKHEPTITLEEALRAIKEGDYIVIPAVQNKQTSFSLPLWSNEARSSTIAEIKQRIASEMENIKII